VILLLIFKLDVAKEGARLEDRRIQHLLKRAIKNDHYYCSKSVDWIDNKRMSNDQEIEDIIAQLQELQIGQSKLLKRLEQLTRRDAVNNNTAQRATVTRDIATVRDLAIGDRVRIKNPRFLQPTSGTVSKINPKRITILAANGTSIVRAPKNIILE
jgi:hypothetical protein